MSLFSGPFVEQPHPVFVHLRDSSTDEVEEDRCLIEELWSQYEPHADSNYKSEFQRKTPSRLWEMRLGCALLERRFEIRSDDAGPDIQIVAPVEAYIEAIAMEPGHGRNEVVDIRPGSVGSYPDRALRHRYLSGFEAKSAKFRRYREKGRVENDTPLVIAIDASKISGAWAEDVSPTPTMVSVCFGRFEGTKAGLYLLDKHQDIDADDVFNVFHPGSTGRSTLARSSRPATTSRTSASDAVSKRAETSSSSTTRPPRSPSSTARCHSGGSLGLYLTRRPADTGLRRR